MEITRLQWTGVAVADGVVYVQEYEFPEAGAHQYEQRLRVRRINRDGKVTTLTIVEEKNDVRRNAD